MSDQSIQKPVHVARCGGIKIPVWERVATKNGRQFKVHSARIEHRIFNENTGEFEDSSYFTAGELADLQDAARAARDFMRLKEEDPQAPRAIDP